MNGNGSHPTMKIIKPSYFRRVPRLRASPRHGGTVRCFANILTDIDPPRGRPVGGGGGHRMTGIGRFPIAMELCNFMGNPQTIFLNALFALRPASAPAAVAPPGAITLRR